MLSRLTQTYNFMPSSFQKSTIATPVSVANGGTGLTTLTDKNLLIGAGTGNVTFVAPSTSGNVLTSNGTSWVSSAPAGGGALILLKSSSGQTTNASAENVDTVDITGLTAKDRIIIHFYGDAETANTTAPKIYSTTDSSEITNIFNGDFFGTISGAATITLTQSQVANTQYGSYCVSEQSTTIKSTVQSTTGHTAWTGSWTMALRHGGVVDTGTFHWTWSVYKLLGQ